MKPLLCVNFSNKVKGLCGNFNQDSTDDYINRDGTDAVDDIQIGNSWQDPK